MQKMIRPPKPDWWEETVKNIEDNSNRLKVINYLAEATQWHSAFTDRLFDLNTCEIYFFNSNLENIWEWDNVYLIHKLDKISTKDISPETDLLRPDKEGYDFDRYFEIDFETGEVLVKKTTISDDKKCANTTINHFQLNYNQLVEERKNEIKRYNNILYVAKKTNLKKEEKDINYFSFRFYLEIGIKTGYFNSTYLLRMKYNLRKYVFNEYINSIYIQKYFAIENLKISNLGDKKEIFLLGENGVGKTLILQAIALASYSITAPFLFKYLDADESRDSFRIEVIDALRKKYAYNDAFQSEGNSVFAYGISRLNEGKQEENGDKNHQNILSLFKRDYRFINPIEWLKEVDYHSLKGIGTLTLAQAKKILTYFLAEEVEIIEDEKGDFFFQERGTQIRHFSQLSDGYRSVLIWISDLLSRLAERNPTISDPKEYKATVMVDEIGEYLHPTWEYGIVQKLRNAFPKIQWIFTTHSPVVVLGASKDAILYKLYKENGITKVSEPYPISAFSNYLIDGFATSPLFNLPTSRPVSFEGDEYELETGNYLYDKIHEEVLKRLKEKPLQNKELKNLINELLDKYEKEGIL